MKSIEMRVLLALNAPRIREAQREGAMQSLIAAGLVEMTQAAGSDGQVPELTDRGFAFVDALVALPLPEQITHWVVPNSKDVEAQQAQVRG